MSPVLLMTLPMTPGVDQTCIVDVVCPTVTCGDNMIHLYALSRSKGDAAEGASISLPLVQHQPLFHIGFPSYLTLPSLPPVLP